MAGNKSEYIHSLEEQLEGLKLMQEQCKSSDKVFDYIKLSNQIVEVSARLDKARLGH